MSAHSSECDAEDETSFRTVSPTNDSDSPASEQPALSPSPRSDSDDVIRQMQAQLASLQSDKAKQDHQIDQLCQQADRDREERTQLRTQVNLQKNKLSQQEEKIRKTKLALQHLSDLIHDLQNE